MTGCKILLIDDDTDDVDILKDALRKSGVDSVHSESSAMQAFIYLESITSKENLPSLIVTDLYLPGITGAEFLQDLKAMQSYSHIPVVVLSSVKPESEIERYKALGAKDYLLKPSTYQEYMQVAAYMKNQVLANAN